MIKLESFDPERICLCPMCDMPIFDYEESAIVIAGDCKCLAHSDCVKSHLEEGELNAIEKKSELKHGTLYNNCTWKSSREMTCIKNHSLHRQFIAGNKYVAFTGWLENIKKCWINIDGKEFELLCFQRPGYELFGLPHDNGNGKSNNSLKLIFK